MQAKALQAAPRSLRTTRRALVRGLLLGLLALSGPSSAAPSAAAHAAAHRGHRAKAHCHAARVRRHRTCAARRSTKRRRTPQRQRTVAPADLAPTAQPQATPPAPTTTLLGGDLPTQSPTPGPLRWRPPALVNPLTVTVGTGFTRTTLSTTQDYVVKLPSTVKRGGTTIIGGHNVVILGGAITIPAGAPNDNMHRAAIYVKDATGTVHVEGVHIDDSGGELFDGVTIAAPLATVQLENLRIVGMHGGMSSFHADVVQPWGGVGDLRIDHLTGTSDYQGLTLQQDVGPIGRAELSNVDLTALTPATIDGGGHMLWLTTGSTTCTTYPIDFANVFVRPRSGRTMANSVWPQFNTPVACRESGAAFGTWPSLPFTGGVTAGAPPGGSYVTASAAGLGYVSPGYAGS